MCVVSNTPPLSRAWYDATINDFLTAKDETVLGRLVARAEFDVTQDQRSAWLAQIQILKNQLVGLTGWVFFEFNIPRMGRRADVILVIGPVIFVLEFKVGECVMEHAAIEQVWDYALDLKNFHQASHNAAIVPLLVATEWPQEDFHFQVDNDQVFRPVQVSPQRLRAAIDDGLGSVTGPAIDAQKWARASYLPTPTIIEAARALYAQHSVQDIARSDASAQNLHVTSGRIEELVDEARTKKQKYLCLVTGVPGAGKTLVGLNVATRKREAVAPTYAVFLSGNGPLVTVLREALTRDELLRRRLQGETIRKGKIRESVKAFIQPVHHFRDDGLTNSAPPAEHIVIFDEAQRAWNCRQTANFMKRRKNQHNFALSEPEFLLSCMDRHQDWAVLVGLVGGGQEINTGEAGIKEWLNAARNRFSHWKVFLSPRLTDSEYAAGQALELIRHARNTHLDEALHLAVSMRSFRTEKVSALVKALLDSEKPQARRLFEEIASRYPIVLTRNLEAAKAWVRSQARGSERYGLVASSRAMRLKPHAIDIRVAIDPVHYFLNGRDDTRSSYYLEDAATEFQVQGLELDWVCVTWDADFRFNGAGWNYHDFRGDQWCNIKNTSNQLYLRNAYRVLLTRARQGMVIFIPPGDNNDPTRSPAFYDSTFDYLKDVGIPVIDG